MLVAGGEKMRTACVTGGNGYIASALVKMLLQRGYAVKATVRNPDDTHKNSHLKDLQALGSLEVFRADLDEEGSFDEAVAGCDYAFLVAAPVNFTSENPEKDQIEPSVRGTLNVMRSCAKAGTVRRVVLTSAASSVCIRPLEGDGHVLDEESWSDLEWVTAEKPPSWGYVVSKVVSEKEAMRFAREHGISLVIACPVLTVGTSPVPKVYTSVPASLSMLSGDCLGVPRRPAMLRMMVSDTAAAPDSSGGGGGEAAARPRAGAALFAVPRLFVGFAAKRPSDGESSRSPTSPLDPKALLLRSPRSPGADAGDAIAEVRGGPG